MKDKTATLRKATRSSIYLVLCLTVIAFLAASCQSEHGQSTNTAEREAQGLADSLRNSNELLRWLRSYERQGEDKATLIIRQMYGKCLRDESRFDEAITQHDSCLNTAKELKDTLQIIIALNNQGTNYRRLGDLQSAAEQHYSALEMSDEYSDKTTEVARKNRVRSLNGLGNVLMSLNNEEGAEEVFKMALAGETDLGSSTGIAINLANLGSIKEKQGKLDSARIYYNQSMEQNRLSDNPIGIALCYHYLGHLDEKTGNIESAIHFFRQSYETALPTGDVWHWLEACNALAESFIATQQLDSAALYINRSLDAAQEINSLEHLSQAYALRSQLEEMRHEDHAALADMHISQMYKDSLENETETEKVMNLRANYESNRRIREVHETEERANIEKNVLKVLTWSAIVIVILLGIVMGVLVRSFRIRKKATDVLTHANEQLLKAGQERQIFYRNLTHQLRTPLTVVIGMVDQLQNHISKNDRQGQEALAATQRQSHELLELVSRLIKASKEGVEPQFSDGTSAPYSANSSQQIATNSSLQIATNSSQQIATNSSQQIATNSSQQIATNSSQQIATNSSQHIATTEALENIKRTTTIPLRETFSIPLNHKTGNGAQVLIAEDNNDVATLIQSIFQNNGYITHLAHDGQEALEMLVNEELPDLIISDIAMPRMDGLQLIRSIRNDETMNHLPIIVVSARVEDNERLEGLDAGAEVYLAKPFIVDELLLRAQKLLEQRATLRKKFSSREDSETVLENLDSEEKDLFNKINELIDKNIAEPTLSSSTLAEMMCMSRSQLNRRIKNLTGDDTSHYIRGRRMMKACYLLSTTSEPIGSIETRCGFDTPGYFSRTFRALYNTTPTEYRKSHRLSSQVSTD